MGLAFPLCVNESSAGQAVRQLCSLMGGGRQGPKAVQAQARITLGVLGTGGGRGGDDTHWREGGGRCVWRRKEEKKSSKPDKASE